MTAHLSQANKEKLEKELEAYTKEDVDAKNRERAAKRIQLTLAGMARDLKVLGDIKIFGSFASCLNTSTSDLDVVLFTKASGKEIVSLLQKSAQGAIEYGFTNMTKEEAEDKTKNCFSCFLWIGGKKGERSMRKGVSEVEREKGKRKMQNFLKENGKM